MNATKIVGRCRERAAMRLGVWMVAQEATSDAREQDDRSRWRGCAHRVSGDAGAEAGEVEPDAAGGEDGGDQERADAWGSSVCAMGVRAALVAALFRALVDLALVLL